MRTTLELNDALLTEARTQAARERTTLTRLIEDGLRLRLKSTGQRESRPPVRLAVYRGQGGLTAAVPDARTNQAMREAADGEGPA